MGKCKFQHKTQMFILLLLLQLVSIHHSKLYFNMDMEHSAVASRRKENGETSYSLGKLIFFFLWHIAVAKEEAVLLLNCNFFW